ncbi:family 10 glycosylhydrolase [Rubrivirga sp.]|uniref:family 10 glycosylhydrolase n=1 Tax=Rubrivirga sp. TaxID=1885344 RepID=UPI003C766C47
MRLSILIAAVALSLPAFAQSSPKYEFRGAWIATVANLDWPSCQQTSVTCTSDRQKSQLIEILDGLEDAGVNAVIFQVRSEGDALYESAIEPWSYWLTGEQGRAPEPFYDPLAFAIEESHARGMELHAWINPYRADRGSNYTKAPSHVTNADPDLLLSFDGTDIVIFDPGLQASRDRVSAIVADIVRRYDVDGIHYDDYFYPYPEGSNFSGIDDEDTETFAANARGFSSIGDWRRDNINLMVAQVEDSIRAIKPEVVHGVSPFGIWKNGTPTGIRGLDAFDVVYADATAWLDAQTIDYLAPQLYWSSAGVVNGSFNNQRFSTLATWWGEQRNERHVYPGLAAYRIGQPGYSAGEIPLQIRLTRTYDGNQGSILFRARQSVIIGGRGLPDSLANGVYRTPALPTPMAWRSQDVPGVPQTLTAASSPDGPPGTVDLEWTAPTDGDADARFYAVYRVEAGANLEDALDTSDNLIAVTGETQATDLRVDGRSYAYVVTSVSANSIESAPSEAAVLPGAVATDPTSTMVAALEAPRPNPATGPVTIPFVLEDASAVTLRVFDVLGREVAALEDGPRTAGSHRVVWQPTTAGTYLVVLEADGVRATRTVSVVR